MLRYKKNILKELKDAGYSSYRFFQKELYKRCAVAMLGLR